jgi:hypothetical protein
LLASSLVAFVAASCGENSQPPAQTHSSAAAVVKSTGAQPQAPAKQQSASGQQKSFQNSVPPTDARWTILCDKVEGPAHVAQAGMIKSRLIQSTGSNDWYVIHTEAESSIYYGYYRDMDNPAEKKRADTDRARIAALADARGNPLIRATVLVPIAPPDPEAPADLNLLNTPQDAYWTIEIATFAGDAKRKEAAVQAVRELRAQGKPAYYFHGETASSVCVGAWKRTAVTEQGTGFNKAGVTRDDAHTQSADTPLLVLGDVVPPNMPSRVVDPNTGKAMTVMAPKLDIVDPDMKKTVADPMFKYHMTNYEYRGTQNGEPDPSVLVVIPHEQSVARQDDWRLGGGTNSIQSQQPQPAQRQAPTAAGDSVLRSLGDH